jgi:hypothetical protein
MTASSRPTRKRFPAPFPALQALACAQRHELSGIDVSHDRLARPVCDGFGEAARGRPLLCRLWPWLSGNGPACSFHPEILNVSGYGSTASMSFTTDLAIFTS